MTCPSECLHPLLSSENAPFSLPRLQDTILRALVTPVLLSSHGPLSVPAGGAILSGNLGSRQGWKQVDDGGLRLPYPRLYSFNATHGCDTGE